jgi:4-amino-4-deoxy-L-arabinose transferase-like glycosyltransferase
VKHITHKTLARLRGCGILAALLLAYAAILADRPTLSPPIGQDEPWIASVAAKLASQGVYGSDLFAGYYGMEQRYYDFMPAYPLLLAGVFGLAGVGVPQMRLLPALCGALVLLLTMAVGGRVGGWRVAALAGALMLALRPAVRAGQLGIPLLDTARVGRYDVAVPLFGLLALWVFLRAQDAEGEMQNAGGAYWRYLLAGVLAGLAGLTHVYGACWLPALLVALVAQRGWRSLRSARPYLLLAGFALAWLPWLLYVASDLRAYVGQLRIVSERFALLDPAFYRQNFTRELDRYALYELTGRWGLPRPARAGAWAGIVGVPLGLALALWRARRAPAAAVAVALATHLLLFALLLQPKTYAYLVGLWPLVALLLAWLGAQLWDARSLALRGALLLLAAAVLAEGALQIRAARAAPATSYEALGARIAAALPPGARILGIHTYWLALRQFPYRSWAVPVLLADGRYNREEALSFGAALERVNPDVVLIDPEMTTFLRALASPDHPHHAWLAQYDEFMRRHDSRLVATIEDATYGRIEVYWLLRTPLRAAPP